jgi:hypothetical protein
VKRTAITVAALAVAPFTAPAVACADPVPPQPDTTCTSDLSGVMSWPVGAKMPLVCQGQQWETVTTPQPPNDRWLSYGPTMTLHGEGQRNPNIKSGDWTAAPHDSNAQCRATQQAVVGPGVVGPPITAEGKAGQPLSFQVVPRLFTIEMSGYCLWTRVGS